MTRWVPRRDDARFHAQEPRPATAAGTSAFQAAPCGLWRRNSAGPPMSRCRSAPQPTMGARQAERANKAVAHDA